MTASDDPAHRELETTEFYPALSPHTTSVAQEMQDRGLFWLANRVLHPFGYAIGVSALADGGGVKGLIVCRTDDFEGIVYGDGEEGLTGRRKLLNWLSRGMKR